MIDRYQLVTRHNPVYHRADIRAPLSVGNGEFAYTADVTGMQSFPEAYEKGQPLCTQSQWGWHTNPKPSGLSYEDFKMTEYDTPWGKQGFPTSSKGQKDLYAYLRQNPHRLHLGQIGMELKKVGGTKAVLEDITDIRQTLDLYHGILKSYFRIDSTPVQVRTACHPSREEVVFSIESSLLREGRLTVRLAFPGASPGRSFSEGRASLPDRWPDYLSAADWRHPEFHHTYLVESDTNTAVFLRNLDDDRYFVRVHWSGQGILKQTAPHCFSVCPQPGSDRFQIGFEFQRSSFEHDVDEIENTFRSSINYWSQFWSAGGAVQLSDSKDPGAEELERRLILSQYLTAVHCAGSMPPQETGLMNNSWYGKFNLEMHWWHAYHFTLWGRTSLLERSLCWYNANLPKAKRMAKRHGLSGARWVKSYGPEDWDDAMPSGIGPLLIWCQPHPISFAEACYKACQESACPESGVSILEKYGDLVLETAEYMADFVVWDRVNKRYILAPPIATAQEVHPPMTVCNPSFELSYWRYGLKVAQRWRERMKLGRSEEWDDILQHLSKLPVYQGVYLAHENCRDTYTRYNYDHPSFLACFGVLPGEDVDHGIMTNTLARVLRQWDLKKKSWGWDYPMIAMTAARLGQPDVAVSILLNDLPQNQFLANGHNATRSDLPCYLPANGALLTAVALMAAGWEGGPEEEAPGFPKDGSWAVQQEGIRKYG